MHSHLSAQAYEISALRRPTNKYISTSISQFDFYRVFVDILLYLKILQHILPITKFELQKSYVTFDDVELLTRASIEVKSTCGVCVDEATD